MSTALQLRETDTMDDWAIMRARFWAKVKKTENCWTWEGARTQGGYGAFPMSHRRTVRAHRFAWLLEHGEWPKLCVLHRCDNPACVRPQHLFLGTIQDNNLDKLQKGRQARGATHGRHTKPERTARGERHGLKSNPAAAARGEANASAKLTESIVVEVRHRYAAGGISQRQLAKEYGVAQATMRECLSGKTWKHLPNWR